MKNDKKWWFFIPGLLGLILSRIISIKYGIGVRDKVGVVILAIIILYLIFSIIYFVAKKYYLIAIGILAIFIPLSMCAIGIYVENERLVNIGLLLVLIVMFVMYILLKIYVKNKNK